MGKIIKFPVPRLTAIEQPEVPNDEVAEERASADALVQRILRRRHVRARDESLLSDQEFLQMLQELEEEERKGAKEEGMGILFWLCLLLIIL